MASEVAGGALRAIAASFGIEFDDKKLQKGVQSIDGAVGVVQKLAAVIAGSGIVTGLNAFASEMIDTGAALTEQADALRINTNQLQSLRHAFATVGVPAAQADSAISGFTARLEAARMSGGSAGRSIRLLGIHVRDAHRHIRPVSELLPELAQRMDRITDPAERSRVAFALFGSAGRRVLNLLHSGAGGLGELQKQLDELGGGMSGEAIEAAQQYAASLETMHVAALSLKSAIAVFLLPAFKRVTDWVTHALADFIKLARSTRLLQTAGIALGAALVAAAAGALAAWAPVLLPIAAIAVVIAGLILIVEDLWGAFNGADSVTGRIFGINDTMHAMHDAVTAARLAWLDLGETVSEVIDSIQDAMPNLNTIRNGILEAAGVDSAAYGRSEQTERTQRRERFRRERAAVTQSDQTLDTAVAAAATNQQQQRQQRLLGRDPYAVPPATPGHAAPAAAVASTTVHQTTHVGPTTNHFNITGQNPREITRQIEQVMDRRQRDQAEAAHPQPPSEG